LSSSTKKQTSLDDLNDLIDHSTVLRHPNFYMVSSFEQGVTIYKQQVRALNLIYALHAQKRLTKSLPIAVIGGGIAGVTFTAGALTLGYSVHLFEKTTALCHVQKGSMQRWVHPHIYDWPSDKSANKEAGLPILDWRAEAAENVVSAILEDFKRITEVAKRRYVEHLRVSVLNTIIDPTKPEKLHITYTPTRSGNAKPKTMKTPLLQMAFSWSWA